MHNTVEAPRRLERRFPFPATSEHEDNGPEFINYAMAWLGPSDKLAVLADHIKRVSKRMFEIPEFFFYAIADGVCRLFSRHGRWNGLDGPAEPEEPCKMELAL